MNQTMNDLFFAYIRLYGQAFAGQILSTLQSAAQTAEQTGDDFLSIAYDMLNDLF